MGYYSEIQKEPTTDSLNNMDELKKQYAKWKKPISEDYILYDFYTAFPGKMKL